MGGSGYSNVARGGDKEAGFEFHDGGVDSIVFILLCWWENESEELAGG